MQPKERKKSKTEVASSTGFALDEKWFYEQKTPKPISAGPLIFTTALFAVGAVVCLEVFRYVTGGLGLMAALVAVLVGFLLTQTFRIAMEWERVAVTRFGTFARIAGPGLFVTIPIIEQASLKVDLRVMATPFGAERTLTSDLVPVDVDAVLLWMVWDPKKACFEVEDYAKTVSYIAQTSMREAIGRASIARVALQRNQIDKELKEIIDVEVEPFGISILSVKIRDIVIPEELQEIMSLEAQAEREKNARIVVADAELELSDLFTEAGNKYKDNAEALRLRTMHMLYETVVQSGGSVVTLPNSVSDGFAGEGVKALAKELLSAE